MIHARGVYGDLVPTPNRIHALAGALAGRNIAAISPWGEGNS